MHEYFLNTLNRTLMHVSRSFTYVRSVCRSSAIINLHMVPTNVYKCIQICTPKCSFLHKTQCVRQKYTTGVHIFGHNNIKELHNTEHTLYDEQTFVSPHSEPSLSDAASLRGSDRYDDHPSHSVHITI